MRPTAPNPARRALAHISLQPPGDRREDLARPLDCRPRHSRQRALHGALDGRALGTADAASAVSQVQAGPAFVRPVHGSLDQPLLLQPLQDTGDRTLVKMQLRGDLLGDKPGSMAITRMASRCGPVTQITRQPLGCTLELMIDRPEQPQKLEGCVMLARSRRSRRRAIC